jgi:hypothetical protein
VIYYTFRWETTTIWAGIRLKLIADSWTQQEGGTLEPLGCYETAKIVDSPEMLHAAKCDLVEHLSHSILSQTLATLTGVKP